MNNLTDIELIEKLVSEMKNHDTNYVYLYRYGRDNDGDWVEQDMRELYDEQLWESNCLNGKFDKNHNYPDIIENIWDEISDRELWKNPSFNPGTDGIYDETIMSAGHTCTIIFKINDDNSYQFDEICEYW